MLEPHRTVFIALTLSCARTGLDTFDASAPPEHDAVADVAPDVALDVAPDAPTKSGTATLSVSFGPAAVSRACAVSASGVLKCWGSAPVGDGSESYAPLPVIVPVAAATEVTAMTKAACAVAAGVVSCWGDNSLQIGQGPVLDSLLDDAGHVAEPNLVPNVSAVIRMSIGGGNVCVIESNEDVVCWGNLGTNGSPTVMSFAATDAIDVAVGLTFACVLGASGAVSCIGSNTYGQLGNGSFAPVSTATLVEFTDPAIGLAAGDAHVCTLHKSGTLRCWGDNLRSELGIQLPKGVTASATPLEVPLTVSVSRVRAGGNESCVVTTEGELVCWGGSPAGDGSLNGHASPTAVPNLSGVADVALSHTFSCALRTDESIMCWGYGPLGNGSPQDALATIPEAVVGFP